jgi:tRNA/rRNA methyltransferase
VSDLSFAPPPIRIVLVEPAGARNLGAVARVMKNMGLRHLVLVNPHCDPGEEEAQHMAVHAKEILTQAQQVASIPEALAGCGAVVATTSRNHPLQAPTLTPRQVMPQLAQQASGQLAQPAALIFGPEDRGLSDAELSYAQTFMRIPSHSDYPSLNLAQAVGICGYELAVALAQPPAAPPISPAEPAAFAALESYFQHLETLLLQIGYLYPQTQTRQMQKIRRLFQRAHLSSQEVALLRGMVRQMEWGLKNCINPPDNK